MKRKTRNPVAKEVLSHWGAGRAFGITNLLETIHADMGVLISEIERLEHELEQEKRRTKNAMWRVG